jgi:hypothetical protein
MVAHPDTGEMVDAKKTFTQVREDRLNEFGRTKTDRVGYKPFVFKDSDKSLQFTNFEKCLQHYIDKFENSKTMTLNKFAKLFAINPRPDKGNPKAETMAYAKDRSARNYFTRLLWTG